jgi:xanthine dehydrogenase accessory factor
MEKQRNARKCFVCGFENPIGLHLGGRTPQETALSILVEIVAVKNGRTGRSLCDTAARIGR